ncbi:MAG: DUF1009 domain-containing protein [Alphaproteobacteria bacterium]|nr:DUF1009 domain-containing protein [Alphaproteobacteria bacterium]
MTAWKKLAIIAGGGELPVLLAEHLAARGAGFYVARIAHHADPRLDQHPGETFNLGEMGARIAAMKAAGCDAVTLIGVVRRPDFAKLALDDYGRVLLPDLIAAAREGDDALLRVLVKSLEEKGLRVIGAEAAFAELLAGDGAYGAHAPDERARRDIAKAAAIADALNAWDVGQAIVVCDGLVLAVEAQEGTDEMLGRTASLPLEVRGSEATRRGVLLKRPKPGQERRIDLPTIGVRTIEGAAKAGLAGVAVEAGGALVVRRSDVVACADALGLFVYGFTAADLA